MGLLLGFLVIDMEFKNISILADIGGVVGGGVILSSK